MGRICAFTDCSNSTYTINRWKAEVCEKHNVKHDDSDCDCLAPFMLYPFPTEKKNPAERSAWINAVKREDPQTKKTWIPKADDRVCSNHFIGNVKSNICAVPCINLGYKPDQRKRPLLKERFSETKASSSNDPPCKLTKILNWDHDKYTYECDCCDGCSCTGCVVKENQLKKLLQENRQLKDSMETANSAHAESNDIDFCDIFLKYDAKVKTYTGLVSREAFEALHNLLQPKAEKLQYWCGEKNTTIRSRPFKSSPMKMGPQRKLTTKQELFLVLMKLRLGVHSTLLADIVGVSEATVSKVFNTWIKFLAEELKPLIVWPSAEVIKANMPQSLKQCKNLRCTIDCTEIFISRPRDRELQVLTWSDYKKHNTVKFLVGIAPNGTITYISNAWGRRASDRHITITDGFMDLVEQYDPILADRGFTIREDLLQKMATLEIPPPSSGMEQMSTGDVKKTKKIANARIHVERAIGRIKWFAILQGTLPINLVPLIDDILVVCAALCNLLPPLVE